MFILLEFYNFDHSHTTAARVAALRRTVYLSSGSQCLRLLCEQLFCCGRANYCAVTELYGLFQIEVVMLL
jgi:hypothetical protein